MKRFLLGFLVLLCSIGDAQNTDSLKLAYKNALDDTTRCNILNQLIVAEPDDNIWTKYNDTLKGTAEKHLNDKNEPFRNFYIKALADAYNNMGFLAMSHGNMAEALDHYTKCVKSYEQVNHLTGLSVTLNNIGGIYRNLGDIPKALDYYYNSLKIKEQINDKASIGISLFNIAALHKTQNDIQTALEYNQRALKISEEMGDKAQTARALNAIGIIYMEQKKYAEALKYYDRSLEISMAVNDKRAIGSAIGGIGSVHYYQGDLAKALEYFQRSRKYFEEINDKREQSVNLSKIGTVYMRRGDLKLAEEFALKALKLSQELAYPLNISTCANLLKEIYQKQNKPGKALEMLELFVVMKDSITKQSDRKLALKKQFEYEFSKKEKEILSLEKENTETAALAETRKLWFIITVISCALAITVLLLIIMRVTSLKKQKQIEFEKSKLEFEQKALRAQMNPHFIFNAINSIQGYILNKNEQEAYDYLAKFSKLIRIVLNNSEENELSLHDELEMINLYVEIEQLRFNGTFDFTLSIPKDINTKELIVPAMLIQPYVENAIWHGLMNLTNERRRTLKIDISVQLDLLKIIVEDNGIGRKRSRDFKKNDTHRSVGMKLTEQRLLLMNKMEEYENAKVIVDDVTDNKGDVAGTIVEIVIPLHAR